MAAAEILATGSTAAQSSDIVVADGAAITLLIKGNGSTYVELAILVKSAAGSYVPTGKKLTSAEVRCLQAPGTYRLARAEGVTCGADSA